MSWDKEKVLEGINAGLTVEQLATELQISSSCLRKHCAREGIILSTKKSYRRGKNFPQIHPEIDEQWLTEHWVNTDKSMHQLSIEFNVPESLIETRRAKWNLKKRFKYKVNLDKLCNMHDPNVWYIAGLLATDGYFPDNTDGIEFTFVGDSEKQLLFKIKEYFECTAPIMPVDHNAFRLRICGTGIKEFFSTNFNIPLKHKTFELDIPQVSVEDASEVFIAAYLRGCIDGDGSINKKCNRLCLVTASETFIKGLKYLIEQLIHEPVVYWVQKNANGKAYPGIKVYEKGLQKLCSQIYKMSMNDLFLDRKFQQCNNKYCILN